MSQREDIASDIILVVSVQQRFNFLTIINRQSNIVYLNLIKLQLISTQLGNLSTINNYLQYPLFSSILSLKWDNLVSLRYNLSTEKYWLSDQSA